jgi:hypothetical protein
MSMINLRRINSHSQHTHTPVEFSVEFNSLEAVYQRGSGLVSFPQMHNCSLLLLLLSSVTSPSDPCRSSICLPGQGTDVSNPLGADRGDFVRVGHGAETLDRRG